MAQGGLHRGVAVCGGIPGPPVTQPSPRLVCVPLPSPPHLVFCTGASWGWSGVRQSTGESAPRRRQGLAPTATVLTAPG